MAPRHGTRVLRAAGVGGLALLAPVALVVAAGAAGMAPASRASLPVTAGSGPVGGILGKVGGLASSPPAPPGTPSTPGGGTSAGTTTAAPALGPFVVSGSRILDQATGTPVVFRGVEVAAYSLGAYPAGFVDANALQTMKAWGVNMVRLGISSDQYLQQCGGEAYDPNYRSELSQAVAQMTSAGIFVVIEIANSNPHCYWTSPQKSNVAALPGNDVLATVTSLAAAYGGNPLVGYEPFNEPQGCARSATGAGATQYYPSSATKSGVCPSEAIASLAWNDPGTVTVQGTSLFGTLGYVGGKTYAVPGMNQLYQAIMTNVPAGAPAPLVLLDANYFASDPGTFDGLTGALAGASNIVEVFHPYDCQDQSPPGTSQIATCEDVTPESCASTSEHVKQGMVDPATGASWSRPVVFDEFNFPAGEQKYQGKIDNAATVPISLYQHGYWVNNMIAAMESAGAAGWDVFYLQNADIDNWVGPYSMVPPGITPLTAVPWAVNANDAPAVAAMGGSRLSCEEPPLGYG